MKLFRLFHKMHAKLHKKFWLPCPVCGEYFGGHEWVMNDHWWHVIPTEQPGRNVGVCPKCGYKMGLIRIDYPYPFNNWITLEVRAKGYGVLNEILKRFRQLFI